MVDEVEEAKREWIDCVEVGKIIGGGEIGVGGGALGWEVLSMRLRLVSVEVTGVVGISSSAASSQESATKVSSSLNGFGGAFVDLDVLVLRVREERDFSRSGGDALVARSS